MIEVQGIRYGFISEHDGTTTWPLVIEFGTRGPEGTVDDVMEGEAHTFMEAAQLLALITEMQPMGEVNLVGHPPVGLIHALLSRGYFVRVHRPQ
jgi:hypothetical protein